MKNIKLIRVIKDYTQVKVQMDTGISQSMLSKYESGDTLPTVDNLMILAKYYNTSLDYLMDLTDEKKPYPRKQNNLFGALQIAALLFKFQFIALLETELVAPLGQQRPQGANPSPGGKVPEGAQRPEAEEECGR